MQIDMLHFGVKIFDAAVSRLDLILGGEGWYIFWRVPVAIGWESVWSPTFSSAGRGNPLVPLLPPGNLPEQPGLREALTLTCWICPDSVQCTWRNICQWLSIALTENPRGVRLYVVSKRALDSEELEQSPALPLRPEVSMGGSVFPMDGKSREMGRVSRVSPDSEILLV